MKKKTILTAIGIILILVLSAITAIYLHFKPLLEDEEMKEVKSGLLGVSCIGKGCHSFSASSTSGFGGVDCRGYQFFYICLSDAEKYCRFFKPFEPRERCVCEVKSTTESRDSFKKFCPKNNLCYGNSFEYEFGCSEDIEKVCKRVEDELGYREREYLKVDASKKIDIFNNWNLWRGKSPIEGESIYIKDICTLLCTNCNSTLCEQNNICEYVKYPIDNTLQTVTQTATTSTTTTLDKMIEKLTIRISYSYAKISQKGRMESLISYSLPPISQGESINRTIQINQYDKSLYLSLNLGGSNLDLHLYSPSGQHVGYNSTTNSMDLIQNSTYTTTNTSESITIQNPEQGNWTIQIYGRNVSAQYETGEIYTLGVTLLGDYKPNLTAGITAKTSTVNEFTSIPVSIRNIGDASAYNLSAIFYSDSFNITDRIILKSLEPDVGLNTEINALPLVLGNATVYLNLTYYDFDGNQYNLINATIMQIITNPRLYIYLDYSPTSPTTADTLKFNITLINIGSSTAYRINLTTQLDSGINATSTNFSLANLSVEQSANFLFNATAQAGRFYAKAYAYYENENRRLFLAGSNEIEIRVEKFSHSIDLDRDSVDEYAENNTYIDPNNNSVALKQMDFNDDNSIDFLIDINNDSIAEIFYDPKNGFIRYGVKFELYNKTPLLFSVEKNVNLDNLIYYDPEKDIITKLKRYNISAYYIDENGDGIFDMIYDLFTKTATDLHK